MENFLVGHGRSCTTPKEPVQMAGYKQRTKKSTGVHDDLFFNAIALSDGRAKWLLAAMDICMLEVKSVAKLKEAIQDATGIPAQNILFNASHTHAGPRLINIRDFEAVAFETQYFELVLEQAAKAAIEAVKDLRPARLEIGSAPLDIGCNRRELDADGRAKLGTNPQGPRLTECAVWRFAREDASDVVLFSAANHGTSLSGASLMISSEWMGDAVRKIEAADPGIRALFFQGCCGDQNVYRDPNVDLLEKMKEHGTAACASVLSALKSMSEVAPTPIVNIAREISLPVEGGETGACQLHALRIGDAQILGIAGEPFVEFALHAQRHSTAKATIVLGYTDGYVGYIPVEQAFAEGGYEMKAYKKFGDARPWEPTVEQCLKRELEAILDDCQN